MRLEWIARHEKENYTLGRGSLPFSRALVLCAWFEFRRHGSASVYIAVLRRLYRQMVRSSAQAVKTPYSGKIQAQAAQKNHCTLTII